MAKKKIKIGAASRFVHTNRIIRKVGLDTDIMIALIDNVPEFSMFKPRIFSTQNILYINYRVFSEIFGHLIHNKNNSKEMALNKIFSFLKSNRIELLKKSSTNVNEVNEIISSLKNKDKY